MAKNKRIKKNWSDEDVQILIWIVSKYADSRGLKDVEKDLVSKGLCSSRRIGRPSQRSSDSLPTAVGWRSLD